MNDLWSKRSPRERVLLVLGAASVIVAVWLALSPGTGPSGKLVPAAEARRKYDAALAEKLALQAEADRLRPALASMTFEEPPEVVVPRVVGQLQGLAKQSGIHLREVKPLRSRRVASLVKVPVSVRFSCPFAQTVPFLYRVEDPAGKLTVEKLNMSTSDPAARLVEVEANIALFTRGGTDSAVEREPGAAAQGGASGGTR